MPWASVQGGTGAEEGSSGPAGQADAIESPPFGNSLEIVELPQTTIEPADEPITLEPLTIEPSDMDDHSTTGWQSAPQLMVGTIQTESAGPRFGIASGTIPALPSTWSPPSSRGTGGTGNGSGRGTNIGDGSGDGIAGLSPTPHARNKAPVYPEEARRLKQEGTVMLRVSVREDGTVESVEIATSCGYELLDQAALQAVRQWLFEPARFNGKAQACQIQLPVRFVLKAS